MRRRNPHQVRPRRTGRRSAGLRSESASTLYTDLAAYYDLIYDAKDYRLEADHLMRIARRFGRSGGSEWLDVACGTGRHLEYLRARYHVTGVDASAAMLRVARHRLPEVELHRGDMRTFDLHRTFDVVSCLFSAIGYLRREREVRQTFRNFFRHLAPGGVVLIEPWVDLAKYTPGLVHLRAYDGADVKVARVVYSDRRGLYALLRTEYLVARPHRGIRAVSEVDALRLTPHERLTSWLSQSGFSVRYLRRAFPSRTGTARGLLVGVRPEKLGA